MTPATVRVAMWSARHRWIVLTLWFVATLGTFALSQARGGIETQGATGGSGFSQTEAAQGYRVLGEANVQREPGEDVVVVLTGSPGAAQDPDFRSAIADVVANLRAATFEGQPVFDPEQVIDPLSAPPTAGLFSADGNQRPRSRPDRLSGRRQATDPTPAIRSAVDAARSTHPSIEIHALSGTMINEDINEVVDSDLSRSLIITIPATFLILLIAFGAFAAAVVPLVLAITSLLAAFGLLGLYSQFIDPVSAYATQLVVLIGLAVAVDYSLFMITRFRAERRRNETTMRSIEIASGTAGRAVFFSGIAVMISVAALYVLPDALFHSMALGTIAVILVSVAGSLTFLPAVLAVLGRRIDSGRLPWFGRDRPEESGPWSRVVRVVMRRPVLATVLSTLILLALAAPAVNIRFGTTDITAFPESIDGVVAIERLREHWPEGTLLTLDVVVTNAQDPRRRPRSTP